MGTELFFSFSVPFLLGKNHFSTRVKGLRCKWVPEAKTARKMPDPEDHCSYQSETMAPDQISARSNPLFSAGSKDSRACSDGERAGAHHPPGQRDVEVMRRDYRLKTCESCGWGGKVKEKAVLSRTHSVISIPQEFIFQKAESFSILIARCYLPLETKKFLLFTSFWIRNKLSLSWKQRHKFVTSRDY